jgi:hypothetical protein
MRGHARKRGEPGSWEYIVDVGMAAAQRCESRNKRFWVERRPKESCPKCGGVLRETEERRREIKGDFATRKECVAAMNKILVAVEQHAYTAPTKPSVKEYLTKEWLPAVKATIRPTTYNSYEQHVACHIAPHIGSVKLQKLSGSQVNALYAKLAESVTCYFRQAVAKSMLPPIRLHDLRHTHATLALQAGIHPKVVSERLGHATISITLDTYSHAIPAMQEEAAALIAELVFAGK